MEVKANWEKICITTTAIHLEFNEIIQTFYFSSYNHLIDKYILVIINMCNKIEMLNAN